MPGDVLASLVDKYKAPTATDKAIAHRLTALKDENGNIPQDAEMTAQMQMQALRTEGTAGGLDSTQ